MQHLKPALADRIVPGWKQQPNQEVPASVQSIARRYGWDPEQCILIDGRVYYFANYNNN